MRTGRVAFWDWFVAHAARHVIRSRMFTPSYPSTLSQNPARYGYTKPTRKPDRLRLDQSSGMQTSQCGVALRELRQSDAGIYANRRAYFGIEAFLQHLPFVWFKFHNG